MHQRPAIDARKLYKTVKVTDHSLEILRDVSLEVAMGETIAITGRSGSGKSTLIGLLAGLDLPTSGRIEVAGETVTDLDEDQRAALRGRHIGFVFQSFQLLSNLTAIENVSLPLEIQGIEQAEIRACDILTRVGLADRMQHYPKQLSGGEQQRVALARAFAPTPTLLFADEPTGNLDGQNAGLVADLLFDLNSENGTTLILVSHDETLAGRCQRQVVMDNGQLVG